MSLCNLGSAFYGLATVCFRRPHYEVGKRARQDPLARSRSEKKGGKNREEENYEKKPDGSNESFSRTRHQKPVIFLEEVFHIHAEKFHRTWTVAAIMYVAHVNLPFSNPFRKGC